MNTLDRSSGECNGGFRRTQSCVVHLSTLVDPLGAKEAGKQGWSKMARNDRDESASWSQELLCVGNGSRRLQASLFWLDAVNRVVSNTLRRLSGTGWLAIILPIDAETVSPNLREVFPAAALENVPVSLTPRDNVLSSWVAYSRPQLHFVLPCTLKALPSIPAQNGLVPMSRVGSAEKTRVRPISSWTFMSCRGSRCCEIDTRAWQWLQAQAFATRLERLRCGSCTKLLT